MTGYADSSVSHSDALRAPSSQHLKLGAPSTKARRWLAVAPDGSATSLDLARLRVHHQLGVQHRDLRLLDPQLAASFPSAILSRDRALVVGLEFVKALIATDKCYLTNLDDPAAAAFAGELQRRLAHPASSGASLGPSASAPVLNSQQQLQQLQADASVTMITTANPLNGTSFQHVSSPALPVSDSHGSVALAASSLQHPGSLPHFEALPFELRVLECALDVVSGALEAQAVELEAIAHTALDSLIKKVSTDALERVRRVKGRLVRLATRVETLKEVLERLLDDDSDMRALNLSAVEAEREAVTHRRSLRLSHTLSLTGGGAAPFDVPLPGTGGALGREASMAFTPGPASSSSDGSDEDAEVVEQLLEAYYMQVDNTWNRLQTLTEFVEDTEDFIAIELDSHRNQLIRLDVLLTSFTACLALITAITSLFAMNVQLGPNFADGAPYSWFLTISISTAVLAVATFTGIMIYCRIKQLV